MENKFMTELDLVGTVAAAKRKLFQKLRQSCPTGSSTTMLESFEDLLKKDAQREKDGFQKKIKIKNILTGSDKAIMVPYVEEEKLVHGEFEPSTEMDMPGHGEGEVGDVIYEIPMGEGAGEDGEGNSGGQGSGEHGTEVGIYEIGKALLEKYQLPNLKDKGKKVPTDEYVFDLTDRHKGSGQFLDKKATLRRVVRTNTALGRTDKNNTDPSKLIVSPADKIYRILSRERVWKSQAIVFFLRDYSGSMDGDPTRTVITQHLMIYSWLLVQYEKLVIPRFIVHEMEAQEVSADDYFKKSSGGGTYIASGLSKINEIVESENLEKDYNIYVFQGTDGEDWDREGKDAIMEIDEMLGYVNRMGVLALRHPYRQEAESEFEKYIKLAGFLEDKELFRMHVMNSNSVTEEQNIEAVKALIAQEKEKKWN